jgi:hypothetical protein
VSRRISADVSARKWWLFGLSGTVLVCTFALAVYQGPVHVAIWVGASGFGLCCGRWL